MITRSNLRAVAEDAGLEEGQLRWDYSGRFMHGRTCFGLVGLEGDLMWFTVELGRRYERAVADDADRGDLADADVETLVNALRTDQLGRDLIFYFPGVEVVDDETDDRDVVTESDPDAARDRLLERDL